jgi:biopolymer transport protein ExbD
MKFRRSQGREAPEINLIAFIDVLLVILIFLMVSTTYSKYTELQITLPNADAEKALERPDQINVTVDAKGVYTVDNVRVQFHGVASLAAALNAAAKTQDARRGGQGGPGVAPMVVINADQFAMHQMVINVMEAARLAGYEKLTFAAQTGSVK